MPARVPRPLALVLLAPLVVGCWGSSTDISVSRDTTRVSREVVDRTLATFRAVCAPLFAAHAADVAAVGAVVSDETATEPRRRGWGVHVDLTVTLRGSPRTFSGPVDTNEPARFLMGGGERPGLVAFTPTAAALCDRSAPPGRDQVFVPIPELTALLPRLRQQPTDAQRAWWADEMERAMAGDYQSQRNIAWCRFDGCDGVEPIDDAAACVWRLVIAAARDPRSDASDRENVEFYCRKALTPPDLADARTRAAALFRRIYGRDLPK
ncbi:hypothetical protein EYW49_07885 [Siculibacillus lacustris]|uniref:Uncharacterized protein n=1 Tax=Siculibacillus lacustris TaxID=1549641 RepID=A0A4Q9VSP0_9HYPH|nr:hypothetical protein [Siculibacillus lacustris]TBW39041.1 hypothetical protein EYW49_07885 [Siculibacillus lacustris]